MRRIFYYSIALLPVFLWCAPGKADEVDDYILAQMQKRQCPELIE